MSVQSFRSNSLEEAVGFFEKTFFDLRVRQTRAEVLNFAMTVGTVDTITAGIINCTSVVADAFGDHCSVSVPLHGAFDHRFGRTAASVIDSSTAAIKWSDIPLSVRGYTGVDDSLFVMKLDPDVLAVHLGRLIGREISGPIKFGSTFDLRSGYGAQWWRMTSSVVLALQSPDPLAIHPMTSAPLASAIMTGLLLASEHRYRETLHAWTRPTPPATVRRAMDYIEQHAHEPLTVVQMAAAVGCGVRALQISFKKHLDMTPGQYLRTVRLDRAHAMLGYANPETASVAEVARSWGFNQTSRFAAEYRKVYGVSPSVTLRN